MNQFLSLSIGIWGQREGAWTKVRVWGLSDVDNTHYLWGTSPVSFTFWSVLHLIPWLGEDGIHYPFFVMQIWDIWEKDSLWIDLTLLMLSACLFNLHAKYKPSSSCCSQHSGFQVSGPVGRSCASFTLAPPPPLLTAPSQRTLNVLTEPE